MVFIKNTLCKENAGCGVMVKAFREGAVVL